MGPGRHGPAPFSPSLPLIHTKSFVIWPSVSFLSVHFHCHWPPSGPQHYFLSPRSLSNLQLLPCVQHSLSHRSLRVPPVVKTFSGFPLSIGQIGILLTDLKSHSKSQLQIIFLVLPIEIALLPGLFKYETFFFPTHQNLLSFLCGLLALGS